MGRLIFILGGARSGKSSFAQKLARQAGEDASGVLFIATGSAGDEEMRDRIERHQLDRPSHWVTLEASREIGKAILEHGPGYRAIIVDCLTFLISNYLIDAGDESVYDELATIVEQEMETLIQAVNSAEAQVIVVSNEVGLGLVPMNPMGRAFRDLAGTAHQQVARAADEVYFMVAGLPQRIKHGQGSPQGQ
jgi:adenosylcobinamide kinase/adenosylcobinamide-phosphate guanylyltransferase